MKCNDHVHVNYMRGLSIQTDLIIASTRRVIVSDLFCSLFLHKGVKNLVSESEYEFVIILNDNSVADNSFLT